MKLLFVCFSFALQATLGASQTIDASFCAHDARDEVKAFCADLAQFQTDVNSDKANQKTTAWTDDLNQLDLANRHSTSKAITAVSTSAALHQAQSDIANSSPLIGLPSDVMQTMDQQTGASGSSSGTTSLVSKAGSATLLSLAIDGGALTRSVNGATTTLTTNGDQVFRAITRNQPDCLVNCNSEEWFEKAILNQTNVAASFSLAQQSTTSVPTSGQASGTTSTTVDNASIPRGTGKLSQLIVKFRILDKFDPRSTSFRSAWKNEISTNTALRSALKAVGDSSETIATSFTASAPALDRQAIYAAAYGDSSGVALAKFFSDYFNAAVKASVDDETFRVNIAKVMQARAVYHDAWNLAIGDAAGTLLSLQYSFNKPANQPETHDATVIFGYNFKTMGMLTFNGSASLYGGTLPTGAKYGRMHYGQFAAEYDQNTFNNGSLQGQLSVAGYWQYQPEPSVLNIAAGTVAPGTSIPLPNGTQEFVGTAGSLWVVQGKMTLKGAGGINVPVGVSWSNKTDLLQGSRVGAQIGVSYNFSSLGQLF